MKKSILSLAVAAGVSTTAMAQMHINHNGVGEALVFPLYTAQNGNDTYIAIANTTSNAKAVKIRILEAQNSVEVLDFNLYMSPEDHFSFAITANEDGGASLITADNSCTVPAITGPIPFRGLKFAGDKGVDDDTTTDKDESFDNTSIARTQIGHIEVIEMGQIDPTSIVFDATLHDETGMPEDCGAHTALWTSRGTDTPATDTVTGGWLADPTFGFQSTWNGGGLYGYGQVVNVAEGTAFGFDAVAIDDMAGDAANGGDMHYEPGNIQPNFDDDAITNDVMTEGFTGTVTGPEVLAVASLFQTSEMENDYVIDPDINALTDWVVTAPTKFYHTNGTTPVVPFNDTWDGMTSCEPVALETWDREEAYVPPPVIPGSGPDFSPSPTPDAPEDSNNDMPLCYETNIVQFGDTSAIKAEDVVVGVGSRLDYTEGWARLDMKQGSLDTDTTNWANRRAIENVEGLPVTGFAVIKYTNSSANEAGALANYAVSTEHKATIVVSTP